MSKLVNTVFIATCKSFNGKDIKADDNGNMPIALRPISGQSPRGLNVINGTVANNEGFELNKCYAISAQEVEPYEKEDGTTVRSFNFSIIGELNPMEAMKQAQESPVSFVIQPSITKKVDAEEPAVNA